MSGECPIKKIWIIRPWNLKILTYAEETVHLVHIIWVQKKVKINLYLLFGNLFVCLHFCSGFNYIHMEKSIMASVTLHRWCMWLSFRSQVSRIQWHRAIGDSYKSTGVMSCHLYPNRLFCLTLYTHLSLHPLSLRPPHLVALGIRSTKHFSRMFNHSTPSRPLGHERKRREKNGRGWVKENAEKDRGTRQVQFR